jgi:outer membrane protein TolC
MAAANQQELFETKYNPKVKLFFNTGLNAVELSGIQRKFGMSAGIDFMLPIYDGGQKDITHQQTEIALNTIQNFKNYALTNIELQKQSVLLNIQQLQDNLREIGTQLKDYKDLINLSEKQLNTGDISMIEYLTLLKNFIELRKTYIEKEIALQLEINNYNYWNE